MVRESLPTFSCSLLTEIRRWLRVEDSGGQVMSLSVKSLDSFGWPCGATAQTGPGALSHDDASTVRSLCFGLGEWEGGLDGREVTFARGCDRPRGIRPPHRCSPYVGGRLLLVVKSERNGLTCHFLCMRKKHPSYQRAAQFLLGRQEMTPLLHNIPCRPTNSANVVGEHGIAPTANHGKPHIVALDAVSRSGKTLSAKGNLCLGSCICLVHRWIC